MNQILYNIIVIYLIGSLFYLLYFGFFLIFNRKKNSFIYRIREEYGDNFLKENNNIITIYNSVNRKQIIVFIIGIIIGMVYLIMSSDNTIEQIKQNLNPILSNNISDVSDIYVK